MSRHTERGFTLIEILIVIGLLGLLVAFFLPNLAEVFGKGAEATTKARLLHLKGCADAFERKHGYYPPDVFADTFYKDMKVTSNGINEGIECLIGHLHYKKVGSTWHFEDKADWLDNTDGDSGNYVFAVTETDKLMEVMDGWGNPIVYFHSDSYGRPQRVMLGGDAAGDEVKVNAMTDPNNKTKYLNRQGYQFISAGDDMVFGTDDDLSFPERPAKDEDQ